VIDGIQVIDFHGHTDGLDYCGMKADQAQMLRAMDAAGVDLACIFNCRYPNGVDSNDDVAAFVAGRPDRFIGFAHVSPLLPAGMVAELERAVDVLKFRGIKLYPPSTPWPLNGPQWDAIYAFADARRLPVIFHTDTYSQDKCRPRLLADIAVRFPNAIFVAGHSGNDAVGRAEAIAAARACPNVYCETCSTFRTPGAIEELVNGAGADRVLYGSDHPLMDPRAQIGKIITAAISDEAKRLVLGDNARRILRL
jgi:predicted TIM-barrel fold metal-dependent hydrolase